LVEVVVEIVSADGTLIDLHEHYGEPAPQLYVTEARGVAKDVQVMDFNGKWVLVYFWSTWCKPCLANRVPALMDFHQKHAEKRDQYQILSICMEKENDLKTLKNMDAYLDPIVRNVWKRKIDFPILLDTSSRTSESFGVEGAGISVLIDPAGNIVEGDLETLAEILSRGE
jgi:thiol-disulfide isomerase/thioredoxin